MMENSKHLLIIDPNVSRTSPSMRAVVASFPYLREKGWTIEVWCWNLDEEIEVDRVVRLPRYGNVHTLGFYFFSYWCFRQWKRAMAEGRSYDVVYSVAWYHTACDVLHVHFSPFDWDRRQKQIGAQSARDWYERLANWLSLWRSKVLLRNTSAKLVLSVSQSVRDDLIREASHLNHQVLENCYNPQVFHQGLRVEVRPQKRRELGYKEDDIVFIFASAGHYRRKGFPLAFEAIRSLRKTFPQAKFLVVGGSEVRIKGLKQWCSTQDPEWTLWLKFTGMVSDIQNYFAAADAFLFPSYSEAFALVEIEAAATGLPLFLTPHHGSEMIMEEGLNGRYIPFNADGIKKVLTEFVSGTWKPNIEEARMLHAINQETYSRRLHEWLKEALVLKIRESKSSDTVKASPQLAIVTRARGVFFKPLYEALIDRMPEGWQATLIRPKVSNHEHPEELVTPASPRLTVRDVQSQTSKLKGDDSKLEGKTTNYDTFWPSQELRDALEEAKSSILLIHEFSPFTLYALYYAKKKGIPVVVSTEVGRANADFFKWTTRLLHSFWGTWIDGVVACCPAAHRPLTRRELPTVSAYHAVDARKYRPLPKPSRDYTEFVYLGRYNRRKGLDLLLEAAALLKKKTEKPFKLKLIGYGDEDWLKNQICEKGLQERVEITGFLSGNRLIEALGSSDVFVLPTRQDTYAAVVHEAACMGLPLLISQHAGACEAIVEDGVNGFAFVPEDIHSFVERMERLLPQEVRESMSLAARQKGEELSAHHRGAAVWDWIEHHWLK